MPMDEPLFGTVVQDSTRLNENFTVYAESCTLRGHPSSGYQKGQSDKYEICKDANVRRIVRSRFLPAKDFSPKVF